jgi:hypothetical protein
MSLSFLSGIVANITSSLGLVNVQNTTYTTTNVIGDGNTTSIDMDKAGLGIIVGLMVLMCILAFKK